MSADRAPLPPREEVPLPTVPPFTAFVGNLAFDMSDSELGDFFNPHKVREYLTFAPDHCLFVSPFCADGLCQNYNR